MKFFLLFLVVVMQLNATLLESNYFSGTSSEGWTGNSVSVDTTNHRLSIPRNKTADKTFVFSGYANQNVTISFSIVHISPWENSDTVIVKKGNTKIGETNATGYIAINTQLDSTGSITLHILANSDTNGEDLAIDDFLIGTEASTNFTRNYAESVNYNLRGDIAVIGNSIMLKNNTCAPANEGNGVLSNNMTFANIDSGNGRINSTSAKLTLPAGVKSTDVQYAALYWQGRFLNTNNYWMPASAREVKFKPYGSTEYLTITSESTKFNYAFNSAPGFGPYNDYQGVADVTTYIQNSVAAESNSVLNTQGFSRDMYVADIQADRGQNGYGGWALYVVYKDSQTTYKNITTYDGYKSTIQDGVISSKLSGFLTPSQGTVNASFFMFAGEGDVDRADQVFLTKFSGANEVNVSLGTNVNQSTITNTDRNPSCTNTIGIDLNKYNIGTNGNPVIIGNGQSSTTISIKTANIVGGDTWDQLFPGMYAFSTDIYSPDISSFTKESNTSSSVKLYPGDKVEYTLTFKNKGNEAAENITVYDTFQTTPGGDMLLNIIDRNVTALKNTIKLKTDLEANYHYAIGSTESVTPKDANCSVDYADNNLSKATKVWCNIPYMAVNETYRMKFSIKIRDDFNTSISEQNVTNIAYSDYYNAVTHQHVLEQGYSNINTAGTVGGDEFIQSGKFDVVETTIIGNDRSIYTKIVNKPISLKVVSLNDQNQIAAYQGINYNRVYLFVVDSEVCTQSESGILASIATLPRDNYVTFMKGDSSQITPDFLVNAAGKNKRVVMNFINWNQEFVDAAFNCSNSNTQAVLNGVPQCLNSDSKLTQIFPNLVTECLGGIRPACQSNSYAANGVPSAPYDNDFGCYQCLAGGAGAAVCSTDNFAIRPNQFDSTITANQTFIAKQPIALTFTANQFGGTGTTNYNETENTSFVADVKISDDTKVCAQPSINFTQNINFTDGSNVVGGAIPQYALPNVGDFTVTIKEKEGAEYALVDADDTLDSDRYITPFTQQIKVVPASFTVVGNIANGSNGFTYLSNFEAYPTAQGRTVSASLNLNITAKAVDDATLSNYTSTCYAKDGTLTMTLGTALSIAPLTKMIWYDQNHDLNGSRALGGTSYPLGMFASQFDSPTNGMASVKYRLNFDRNERQTINPFTMNVTNVAAQDVDNVNGGLALGSSINYRYGRIIPRDVRVFGAVQYTANGWYEVYNSPSIGTTALPISRNDSVWNVNLLHNELNDGDASVTVPVGVGNVGAINGVDSYIFPASAAVPFSTKAHIRTVPWLWYGANASPYSDPGTNCLTHPCFNINIVPAVGATGSARTGAGNVKGSKTTDSNGWKTTNDYAPAVR